MPKDGNGAQINRLLLLGGFLLDGIEPAEVRKKSIYSLLLLSSSIADNLELLRPILSIMKVFIKNIDNNDIMISTFRSIWKNIRDEDQKSTLVFIAYSLNWNKIAIDNITKGFRPIDNNILKIFFENKVIKVNSDFISIYFKLFISV